MSLPDPPTVATSRGRSTAAALAWAVVSAGGLALGWWLIQFWAGNLETVDRALIPVASAWLLHRERRRLRSLSRRPSVFGLALIAPALLLVPAVWYLYAQMGPRPLLIWWFTAAWLAAHCGLIVVIFGWGHLRAVAFPLGFLIFTLPTPYAIQIPLQARLQQTTTACSAAVLPILGIPVDARGFVLRLPSGELGVVEACSGVRSVTAIVAIAALVAYLRGFGWWRGLLLTLLALPIVALANTARVILTGVLQETLGIWATQGLAHELLGIVTLLVGLAGVLTVSHWLAPRAAAQSSDESPVTDPVSAQPLARGRWAAAMLLLATAVLTLAADRSAVQFVSAEEQVAPLEQIALQIGSWQGTDEPIDPEIRDTLALDRAVHRVYRNAAGQKVHVWAVFWTAASAVKGYHHPDVCWPNRGWGVTQRSHKTIELPAGPTLRMTVRRFEQDGRQQVVGYWTQEGRTVWSDEDERSAQSAGESYKWVLDRLTSRTPVERTARLMVLVGTDVWDSAGYAEQTIEEFARALASELYRVCPWARPVTASP